MTQETTVPTIRVDAKGLIYGIGISAARMQINTPHDFRFAKYPDGSQRLQGAYAWSQGIMDGVEWRDIPVVDVDQSGNALS